MFDQPRGRDESAASLVRAATAFPQWPPGAQPLGELPTQPAFAAMVERLIATGFAIIWSEVLGATRHISSVNSFGREKTVQVLDIRRLVTLVLLFITANLGAVEQPDLIC